MGGIMLFLLVWCGFCKLLEEFGPDLFVGIGYLFKFVFLCLWMTLKLLWRVLWWLLTDGRRHAVAGVRAAYLFGRIFWEEWHRPAEEQGAESGAGNDNANAPQGATDPFESALSLLGLRPGFTRDELNKAYKNAIRRAHPDAGGTTAMAAAINAARDLIMSRMGWATTARAA